MGEFDDLIEDAFNIWVIEDDEDFTLIAINEGLYEIILEFSEENLQKAKTRLEEFHPGASFVVAQQARELDIGLDNGETLYSIIVAIEDTKNDPP